VLGPDPGRTAPDPPAEPFVERLDAGSEHPELELGPDDVRGVVHDASPEALSTPLGEHGHRLHVAGSERRPADLDRPLDHGRVRHDRSVVLGDHVDAAERVVPVLVAQPFLGMVAEGRDRDPVEHLELLGGELGRPYATDVDQVAASDAIRGSGGTITGSAG